MKLAREVACKLRSRRTWLRFLRHSCGVLQIYRRPVASFMAALVIGVLSGCTNSSIVTARSEIAAGQYTAAHRTLAGAAAANNLSSQERRQVDDGLCLTEYKIGVPQYSLSQQQRTCSAAASEPGSDSAPVLTQIEANQRIQWSQRVAAAIHNHDFAGAEDAIVMYRSIPGADPTLVSAWSHQLWMAVEHDNRHATLKPRALGPAISQLTREYPRLGAMDNRAFRHWIESNMIVAGTPLVSGIEISKDSVNLWIPASELSVAALNLDRFTRVNDAQIVRCRCDGRTNIASQTSGLPAYLVRLDPETRRSEILILAQP